MAEENQPTDIAEMTARENVALRARSGEESSDSRLVSFLYELMRDHLPVGVVEDLVIKAQPIKGPKTIYCNGHLARYAKDLAERLL